MKPDEHNDMQSRQAWQRAVKRAAAGTQAPDKYCWFLIRRIITHYVGLQRPGKKT
jgi:hypothetical protein